MSTLETDASDIATARAQWSARKSDSPLVAWTLSPEWTIVGPTERTQGTVLLCGSTRPLYVSECSGEINAYTRDHHDAFACGEGL